MVAELVVHRGNQACVPARTLHVRGTLGNTAVFNRLILNSKTTWQRQKSSGPKITAIEQTLSILQGQMQSEKKKDEKSGLGKMFDGKNPKLVPDRFEKEGPKSFKKWASQISTYVDLADPIASK
eukprot:6489648-Karenia_brevis.AAC.1